MNELEEYHSRCDELYADLLDCQEQLRVERMKDIEILPDSKRPCFASSTEKYASALLRMDCQSVVFYMVVVMNRILFVNKDELSRSSNPSNQIKNPQMITTTIFVLF